MKTQNTLIAASVAFAFAASHGAWAKDKNWEFHEEKWGQVISYGKVPIADDSASQWGPWSEFVEPAAGPAVPFLAATEGEPYRPVPTVATLPPPPSGGNGGGGNGGGGNGGGGNGGGCNGGGCNGGGCNGGGGNGDGCNGDGSNKPNVGGHQLYQRQVTAPQPSAQHQVTQHQAPLVTAQPLVTARPLVTAQVTPPKVVPPKFTPPPTPVAPSPPLWVSWKP